MKPIDIFVFPGLSIGLAACASVPPAAPDRGELRPAYVTTSLDERQSEVSNRISLTSESLTLELAIETAFLNNPNLQAEFAAFEAAALEVPQASSLDDPRVTYLQFVEGVQTRTGEQQFVAGVSQMFPWFGKLELRGDIARSDALQALQRYRSLMLDIRYEVQRAWYLLAYEKATQNLAEDDKRTIEQTVEVAAAQYSSGQRSRGSLLQSQAELARIENELAGYPSRISEIEQTLAKLLFTGSVDVPALSDSFANEVDLPDAELLISEAVSLRPEIERFRLREQQADFRHELAEKEYYPDMTFGLNYIGIGNNPRMSPSDEGNDAWGVSVGFNIPIPNARRRAAKEQALLEKEEAEWRRIAAESETEEAVRSILPRLTSLDQQLNIQRNNLIPLAEEAYATNQANYTSGRATFIELLDAQRTMTAVKRDLLRTHRDYLLAIADLERTVGGKLTTEMFP